MGMIADDNGRPVRPATPTPAERKQIKSAIFFRFQPNEPSTVMVAAITTVPVLPTPSITTVPPCVRCAKFEREPDAAMCGRCLELKAHADRVYAFDRKMTTFDAFALILVAGLAVFFIVKYFAPVPSAEMPPVQIEGVEILAV